MSERPLGTSTLAVLAAVARGFAYGFEVMDATELKSGTVYRALARLEELELVSSEWEAAAAALEEKRPRRRYYAITAAGRNRLAAAQERLRQLTRLLSPQAGS